MARIPGMLLLVALVLVSPIVVQAHPYYGVGMTSSPRLEDDVIGSPPSQGGCDVAGLTCAASAAIAGSVCVDETFEAVTNTAGALLGIIPFSASSTTTIDVTGCMAFAVGGGIGLSNNFPARVKFEISAGDEVQCGGWGNVAYCLGSNGNVANGNCIPPIGFGQYCADGTQFSVATDQPICVRGRADVYVNGQYAGADASVAGNTVYVGMTVAKALAQTEGCGDEDGVECVVGIDPDCDPKRLTGESIYGEYEYGPEAPVPTWPRTPLDSTLFSAAARDLFEDLMVNAVRDDIDYRYALQAHAVEEPAMVDQIIESMKDDVHSWLNLEDFALSYPT